MPTYVAFLRAINLGATRKFPKDAIKAAISDYKKKQASAEKTTVEQPPALA